MNPLTQPKANHVIVSSVGRYMVVVVARPDGIESYVSCNQQHVGFFATDPADDSDGIASLRPARDILLDALQKLMATGL